MSLEQFYFFLCGAAMTLMLLIIWVSFIIPGINKWNKRFFVAIFFVFVLSMVSLFVDLLIYDDPSMALAEKLCAKSPKSTACHAGFYDISQKKFYSHCRQGHNSFFGRIGTYAGIFSD